MPRRLRKTRTFEDATRLDKNEYYQTVDGVIFYLEDIAVDAMICVGDLVGKFYRINEDQNPLVFKLVDDPSQSIAAKVWHVVWRGNFFMDIDGGSDTGGPHCCRLWFKSFTTREAYWIATLQVMGFFFNEEEMKAYVIQSVVDRKFFVLPENRDKAIVP